MIMKCLVTISGLAYRLKNYFLPSLRNLSPCSPIVPPLLPRHHRTVIQYIDCSAEALGFQPRLLVKERRCVAREAGGGLNQYA